MKKRLVIFAVVISVFLLVIFSFLIHVAELKNPKEPLQISAQQQSVIDELRNRTLKNQFQDVIYDIPFEAETNDIDITAKSAILVDSNTGAILYKKDADKPIPPASMTKLVVMYIVFEEIEKGNIHYDDVVPLPPQSWSVNLPYDASRMYLGKNQIVTVKELLTGLAVASGNDAAIAVAHYIEDDVQTFVKRMNNVVQSLGLKETRFVEPSGYDENNMTTAREFATFARIYITRFPDSIKMFHSCKSIDYPTEKNIKNAVTIHQTNTNPLLNKLNGVDGLKTGFIYESGYNLALTAKRDNRRYLSVTMMGAGVGSRQGQVNRVKDGTALMEYAFNSYDIYSDNIEHKYVVSVLGSKTKSINLIPVLPKISFTVPKDSVDKVTISASITPYIFGEHEAGSKYGELIYKLDDIIIAKVPLVMDRKTQKANAFISKIDRFAQKFINQKN